MGPPQRWGGGRLAGRPTAAGSRRNGAAPTLGRRSVDPSAGRRSHRCSLGPQWGRPNVGAEGAATSTTASQVLKPHMGPPQRWGGGRGPTLLTVAADARARRNGAAPTLGRRVAPVEEQSKLLFRAAMGPPQRWGGGHPHISPMAPLEAHRAAGDASRHRRNGAAPTLGRRGARRAVERRRRGKSPPQWARPNVGAEGSPSLVARGDLPLPQWGRPNVGAEGPAPGPSTRRSKPSHNRAAPTLGRRGCGLAGPRACPTRTCRNGAAPTLGGGGPTRAVQAEPSTRRRNGAAPTLGRRDLQPERTTHGASQATGRGRPNVWAAPLRHGRLRAEPARGSSSRPNVGAAPLRPTSLCLP